MSDAKLFRALLKDGTVVPFFADSWKIQRTGEATVTFYRQDVEVGLVLMSSLSALLEAEVLERAGQITSSSDDFESSSEALDMDESLSSEGLLELGKKLSAMADEAPAGEEILRRQQS